MPVLRYLAMSATDPNPSPAGSPAPAATFAATRFPVSDEERANIEARFGKKKVGTSEQERIDAIRYNARNFAYVLAQTVKPSPELRCALFCLSECLHKAESGVILHG